MWARIVEVMLGCWLAVSPFIFSYAPDAYDLWWTSLIGAVVIWTFALASYWPKLWKVHLMNAAVGAGLVALAFLQPDPPPAPAYQNYAVLGLLLIMFGIIPSRATEPPKAWQRYYEANPR